MDSDDLEPQNQEKKPRPKTLEAISLDAPEEYIAVLDTEVARVGEATAGDDAR